MVSGIARVFSARGNINFEAIKIYSKGDILLPHILIIFNQNRMQAIIYSLQSAVAFVAVAGQGDKIINIRSERNGCSLRSRARVKDSHIASVGPLYYNNFLMS